MRGGGGDAPGRGAAPGGRILVCPQQGLRVVAWFGARRLSAALFSSWPRQQVTGCSLGRRLSPALRGSGSRRAPAGDKNQAEERGTGRKIGTGGMPGWLRNSRFGNSKRIFEQQRGELCDPPAPPGLLGLAQDEATFSGGGLGGPGAGQHLGGLCHLSI